MAKNEVIKNDIVTVRVNEEALTAVPKAVVNELEDIARESVEIAKESVDLLESSATAAARSVRNNRLLVALVTATALGAGGYIGYRYAAKKYKAQFMEDLDREIEITKNFYARLNKDGEYDSPQRVAQRLLEDEGVKSDSPDEDVNVVQSATEALRDYKGTADPTARNYQKVALADIPAEPTVEHIANIFVDGAPLDVDFDYAEELSQRTSEHPYIITVDEFIEGDPENGQETMTYFAEDDTLVDAHEAPVDNTAVLVGDDNLLRFGHGSKDPKIVYVRNEKLGMDMEIIRSENSYAREVLGFGPEDGKSLKHSARRFRQWDE